MSALLSFLISIILVDVLSEVNGKSIHYQSVQTIKTKNGQVYDCVDFKKQSTLNHPLLQAQMHEVKLVSLQSQAWALKDTEHKGGCPWGTVPILRSSNMLKPSTLMDSSRSGEHCIAVVRTVGEGRKFYGATGLVSIYKALVSGKQWSTSRMKLINGQDSVEAGWMVNPDYYKDTEAHFYARFTAGSKGCLNVDCSGFVQVTKDAPLGVIPDHYSLIGDGRQACWLISITKNAKDGNWWLSLGPNNVKVGYWPKSLFTSMAEEASQVEWGGEIDNPEPKETNQPHMGSGLAPRPSTYESASYREVKVYEGNFNYDDPTNTRRYTTCDNYFTFDAGNVGERFGRLIYYGGPKT